MTLCCFKAKPSDPKESDTEVIEINDKETVKFVIILHDVSRCRPSAPIYGAVLPDIIQEGTDSKPSKSSVGDLRDVQMEIENEILREDVIKHFVHFSFYRSEEKEAKEKKEKKEKKSSKSKKSKAKDKKSEGKSKDAKKSPDVEEKKKSESKAEESEPAVKPKKPVVERVNKVKPVTYTNFDDQPITAGRNVVHRSWWEVDEDSTNPNGEDKPEDKPKDDGDNCQEDKNGFENLDSNGSDKESNDDKYKTEIDPTTSDETNNEFLNSETIDVAEGSPKGKDLSFEGSNVNDEMSGSIPAENFSMPPTRVRPPPKPRATGNITQEDCGSISSRPSPVPRPKGTRPMPLKRGARTPMPRRNEPLKPTVTTVSNLLDKLVKLSESAWSDHIKTHKELTNIIKKYPELLKECQASLKISAVKSTTIQANSSRSNVSKSALECLGDIFSICGDELKPILVDVIPACIKKSLPVSPDFLVAVANSTLAKICTNSSEARIITVLLSQVRGNKTFHATVLRCLIITANRMGANLRKLKALPEIVELASNGLLAGNLAIRTNSKLLIGIINEHIEDLEPIILKFKNSRELINAVNQAINKYDPKAKDEFIKANTA